MAVGGVFAGDGDSMAIASVTWIGPAWKMKPKFVGIARALGQSVSEDAAGVRVYVYTQLLVVASCGAHGERLADNQRMRYSVERVELADCSHCV